MASDLKMAVNTCFATEGNVMSDDMPNNFDGYF